MSSIQTDATGPRCVMGNDLEARRPAAPLDDRSEQANGTLSKRYSSMKRTGMVAGYLAAVIIFGIAARVPVAGVVAAFLSFLVMGFAGVVFLSHLAPKLNSVAALLIFGTTLGLACGRLLLVVFDLCFGPSFATAALSFSLLAVVGFFVWRTGARVLPRWNADEEKELISIVGLNAAVLLAMAVAFWGVGRLTSGGYAFAPYFFLDFLSHATCASALARQLPPENPYFAGQIFHYYWFYHLWPAAIINLSGITARSAITLTQPVNAFLFVGSLFCLGKPYMPKCTTRLWAIGLGLFAFSYIGIFFLIKNAPIRLLESISRAIHIDYSCISHSWYRDLLYEPHAVTALSGLLLLVYLESASMTRERPRTSVLAGLVLGVVAVTDLFVGMIALLWFAAMNAGPFLRSKQLRLRIVAASLLALTVVAGAFALQLFPARSGQLRLGIHRAARYGPVYLLIELGPVLLFGVAGLYLCLRRRQSAIFRPILCLGIVSLFVAFAVIVPVEINQIIRKSIKVVQIPLVVLATLGLDAWAGLPKRHWLRWGGAAVVVGGFLTFCTDVFLYTDIQPSKHTATCYVSADRMTALEWVRDHTPAQAVVQLLDEVRPKRKVAINFDISVPAISERRTLFGNYKYLYLTHVKDHLIDARKAILERVFTASKAGDLKDSLDRLPPCYLVVDKTAPGPLDAVEELKESRYLQEVFRAGTVGVFWKPEDGQAFSLVHLDHPAAGLELR